jgi:hypothetical protein
VSADSGPTGRRLPLKLTLSQALSRLATVPPKLFIRERDALVDHLRRAGDKKTAKIVKARRAPTLPVWIVNRLALAHPEILDELMGAADRLKAIQLGRREEPGGLAKAMANYRAVLDRLVDHGRSLLKEAGTGNSSQMPSRVEGTLNAALVNPSSRVTLRRGELETELDAPGFDVFAGARPAERRGRGRLARASVSSIVPQTSSGATIPETSRQRAETPRRHRRRESAEQNPKAVRRLLATVDSARERLAAAHEETHLAKTRLADLLREVEQSKQSLKERTQEARRRARALRLALKALGGHRRHPSSPPR